MTIILTMPTCQRNNKENASFVHVLALVIYYPDIFPTITNQHLTSKLWGWEHLHDTQRKLHWVVKDEG